MQKIFNVFDIHVLTPLTATFSGWRQWAMGLFQNLMSQFPSLFIYTYLLALWETWMIGFWKQFIDVVRAKAEEKPWSSSFLTTCHQYSATASILMLFLFREMWQIPHLYYHLRLVLSSGLSQENHKNVWWNCKVPISQGWGFYCRKVAYFILHIIKFVLERKCYHIINSLPLIKF